MLSIIPKVSGCKTYVGEFAAFWFLSQSNILSFSPFLSSLLQRALPANVPAPRGVPAVMFSSTRFRGSKRYTYYYFYALAHALDPGISNTVRRLYNRSKETGPTLRKPMLYSFPP